MLTALIPSAPVAAYRSMRRGRAGLGTAQLCCRCPLIGRRRPRPPGCCACPCGCPTWPPSIEQQHAGCHGALHQADQRPGERAHAALVGAHDSLQPTQGCGQQAQKQLAGLSQGSESRVQGSRHARAPNWVQLVITGECEQVYSLQGVAASATRRSATAESDARGRPVASIL